MAVGLEQFVKSLEDSGIITPSKLKAVREKLPSEKQQDAQELARELVRLQKLTKFQAQEAYQGKAKNLVLGNYLILDKIGAGGMGQVYKAQHKVMKRIVAIKMLPSSMTKDAAAIARFHREVEAAAKLRHPNIVAADDADSARGIHFLVMEYVEGSDLSALVKKNGPFSVEKSVNYILQAARGLEYAHSEGVVHRDIKPANLLLDKKGTIKILDMGLARLESGIGGDAATAAELTTSGQIMGTVDYMSPEQAFNTKQADARADIYSLGCTLFYLLTGKPLFGGETIMEKLLAHREKPIPPVSGLREDVPEEVEAIYQKMVAKKVEDRYQSMTDVIGDFQPLVSGGSTMMSSVTGSTNAASSNSNLTFLKDAAAGQTIQRKLTKQIKQPKADGSGSKNRKLALVGAAILGVMVLAAGIIISLRTKDGTLIVEIDQPDATVQVLDSEGKVEVSQDGGEGKVTITVDPGKHRLRVERDGFVVFGQEFEIEKGGEKSIKALLMPVKEGLAAPGNADTCRQVADWVFLHGGKVTLWVDGKLTNEITDAAHLPNKTFDIDAVVLPFEGRTTFGDKDLIDLLGLPRLGRLTLPSPNITDEGMKIVRELTNLHQLQLTSSKITNDGLALLGSLGKLSNLDVAATRVTGEGLVHIKAFPKLEYLSIGHLSINDQDLVHLYGTKSLKKVSISTTKVTADGIAALQKALPNCKIEWDDPAKATTATTAPPLAAAPFDAAQAKQHQQAWAKHLGIEVETPNSVGMKMVLIPPGEFMMGSTDTQVEAALKMAEEMKAVQYHQDWIQKDERPRHRVLITRPFCIGATEVTVGDFKKFSASGFLSAAERRAVAASKTSEPLGQQSEGTGSPIYTYLNPGYSVTDDSPATCISSQDAMAYCKWLSDKEKTWYRLPTEAEWEYACRAGTMTQFSFGDDHNELEKFAWYNQNARTNPMPVGKKLPNAFGLLDMHGNLAEWCQDFYGDRSYEQLKLENPVGPPDGKLRILRGGAWNNIPPTIRSAFRNREPASNQVGTSGFRIVREIDTPSTATSGEPLSTDPISAKLFMHDPAFPQWMAHVQAMTAEEQIKAVSKKLVELNPGFDGVVTGDNRNQPTIENGVVTDIGFNTNNVTDISPMRALVRLKNLVCSGSDVKKGQLSDLSPLQGISLATLDCRFNKISDLSSLKGMPLKKLIIVDNQVADLSPLQEMPLEYLSTNNCRKVADFTPLKGMKLIYLSCNGAKVTDLTPLQGMPLTSLAIHKVPVANLLPLHECKDLTSLGMSNTKATPASVAALQKALPNCKIEWDDPAKATTPQPAASGTK